MDAILIDVVGGTGPGDHEWSVVPVPPTTSNIRAKNVIFYTFLARMLFLFSFLSYYCSSKNEWAG